MSAVPRGALPRVLVAAQKSREAILAHVSGLPGRKRGGRHLVVLQAFVDDSGRGNSPVFVMAACVSTVDAWLAFSTEWDEVLRQPPAVPYLKMKEANGRNGCFAGWNNSDVRTKLHALHSVIAKHGLFGVACYVDVQACKEVFAGVGSVALQKPPFQAAVAIMLFVIDKMARAGRTDQVSFIFDQQQSGEKNEVRHLWDLYKNSENPSFVYRHLMGSDPQWEDDKDFNPLQAADLMAWVTRRVHADTTEGKPLRVLDLLPGRMPVPTDIIDQNVDNLRDVARSMLADAPESPFEDDKGRGQRLKRFLRGA